MFAHLPLRYRVTVWALGLVVFATAGAYLALMTALPLLWQTGAALGALLGIVAVAGFLHISDTTSASTPHPHR